MSARKDARQVIRTHILDAVADLGGKAQGGPIKNWILNKVDAKVDDFGRTNPNKKYPQGRFVFVESYTHIQREKKKQGLLYTPAWGWVSLTEGDTVEVNGKTLSKPKKTAESTRKAKTEAKEEAQAPTETLSVPNGFTPNEEQEGETVVEVQSEDTEAQVARVEPHTTSLSNEEEPSVLERVLSLTEDHDVHVDNNAVIEAYVDVESQELVEDIGGSKLWRKSLSEVEDGYILSIGDEHILEEVQDQEPFEVKPFGAEVKAEIDPKQDIRIGYDKEGREWTRQTDALPEEYTTPLTEETDSEQEEVSSLKAQEYTLSEQVEEVEKVEEVLEQKGSKEYVIDFSNDDLFDDDLFEEEEEEEDEDDGLKLLLSKICWKENTVWGEIKDGFVYLAEEEKPSTVLKFNMHTEDNVEGKLSSKRALHTNKLRVIASKGLPAYVEAMIKVKDNFKRLSDEGRQGFKTHAQEEFHGCFGNDKTDKSLCQKICPLSMLCSSAEVVSV